jgi:hypothetical protein
VIKKQCEQQREKLTLVKKLNFELKN